MPAKYPSITHIVKNARTLTQIKKANERLQQYDSRLMSHYADMLNEPGYLRKAMQRFEELQLARQRLGSKAENHAIASEAGNILNARLKQARKVLLLRLYNLLRRHRKANQEKAAQEAQQLAEEFQYRYRLTIPYLHEWGIYQPRAKPTRTPKKLRKK